MKNEMLHIFRNTPSGKEVFLQSLFTSRTLGLEPKVYLPEHRQFLLYFENKVATVELDDSFLAFRESAREHAQELAERYGPDISFLEPTQYTASALPDIPTEFGLLCCPRSIRDLSSKIRLGYIGPGVRAIVKNASFPVLIPTPIFKEWKRIIVFFGGSENATSALRIGYRMREKCGFPLQIFTYATAKPKEYYEELMIKTGLFSPVKSAEVDWLFAEKTPLKDALYSIPHDSLVVIGAYGHSVAKELLFGSMMEKVQTMLPNNILIVGPNVNPVWWLREGVKKRCAIRD
jgi:hypothetical protein